MSAELDVVSAQCVHVIGIAPMDIAMDFAVANAKVTRTVPVMNTVKTRIYLS